MMQMLIELLENYENFVDSSLYIFHADYIN